MNGAVKAAGHLLFFVLAAQDLAMQKISARILAVWSVLTALLCVGTDPKVLLIQALTALALLAVCLTLRLRGALGSGDIWILGILCFFWRPEVLSGTLLWGTLHLGMCAAILAAFYGEDCTLPVVPFLLLGWGTDRFLMG